LRESCSNNPSSSPLQVAAYLGWGKLLPSPTQREGRGEEEGEDYYYLDSFPNPHPHPEGESCLRILGNLEGESCLRILGKQLGGRRRRGYLRGLLVKGEEEEWGEGRIRDDGSWTGSGILIHCNSFSKSDVLSLNTKWQVWYNSYYTS